MTQFRFGLSLAIGIVGFFFSAALTKSSFWFLQSILFAVVVIGLVYAIVRWRWVLYTIFGAYQLAALLFTILVDGHLDLLGLLKYIPWFKHIAFLGIVMIAFDLITWFIESKLHKQENEQLKDENTSLKARIYDMQESAKKSESDKAS